MDIITHGVIGLCGAALLQPYDPMAGVAFAFASIAPDLDALTRVAGAERFLRWHQTWSHALPIQAVVCLLAAAVMWLLQGAPGWWPLAGFCGLALHSLLDRCNTYGIGLWLPFSQQRVHNDAVFFIDAGFALLLAPLAIASICGLLAITALPPLWAGGATSAAIAAYIWWRHRLLARTRQRLVAAGHELISLVPSAAWPWTFHAVIAIDGRPACARWQHGELQHEQPATIYDGELPATIDTVPFWHFMRQMSPAYHAIAREDLAEARRYHCVDLRIRNFSTTFASMDLLVDAEGAIHVERCAI